MHSRFDARPMLALALSVCALLHTPALAQAPASPEPPVAPVPAAPAPAAPAPTAPAPTAPAEPAPAGEPGATDAPAPEIPAAEVPAAEVPAETTEGESDGPGGMEGAPVIKQGLSGRVTDSATGEGIIEGQVQVIDRNKKTLTDLDGNFAISLPPGTYSLRIFYELYEPQRVDRLEVKRGQVTTIDVKLTMPSSVAAQVQEEVVITARADKATEATQLTVRKESAAVRDNISAQEISRSGANNAADAVRRVVSATIDPNNRLIVRGLGSRYTRVLIRGFRIPSTDPDDPGVELDLFPAGVLSNLAVIKTFTPDLPGDFAGGIMQIDTREFPATFLLQANASLGANTESTFQPVLDYKGGKTDWLGFDDGTRALPSKIPNEYITTRVPRGEKTAPFTEAQAAEFGRSFSKNYGVTRNTALPNMSLGLVVGDTLKLGTRDFGYLASVGYQYRTERRVSHVQEAGFAEDGALTAQSDFTDERGRHAAQIGALTTFSLELDKRSDLTLTSLFSQSGSDETNFAEGRDLDDALFAQRRLRFIQRQLFFSQLRGEHRELPRLHKLNVEWNLTVARAGRSEPDTRTVRYQRTVAASPYIWASGQRSPGRFFSNLKEWTLGSQLDLTLPVIDPLKLKAGGQTRHSFGTFRSRRFLFDGVSDNDSRPPDQIFTDENIGPLFQFQEGTKGPDGYDASSDLFAGYGMAEVIPWKPLRLIGGARLESFQQRLEPNSPTASLASRNEVDVKVKDSTVDWLPAGAAVMTLVPDMFLRASYGMTIARPLFRELAPFVYEDDVRRISVGGNPNLKRTVIHNLDLRWEMFPSANEVIAVTGFYKQFIDPIEPYQAGSQRTFQNAKGATNIGGEIEGRLSLGRIAEALKLLQLGVNFTYVWSRIALEKQIDPATGMAVSNSYTNSKRPMAGQSPYVTNVSLGVSDPSSKLSVFAYYNVFGKRIDQVGGNELPDQYELPFHSVDVIGTYNLTEHLNLRLTCRNLAFRQTRIKEGPVMRERFNPGSVFQIGAGFNY